MDSPRGMSSGSCGLPSFLSFLTLLLCAALLSACASLFSYEFRSFFLDGVPAKPREGDREPRPQDEAVQRDAGGPPPSGRTSEHQPWQERQCNRCHDVFTAAPAGRRMTGAKEEQLCLRCHAGLLESRRFWHGPAATGYCLQCHQPHWSELRALLVLESPPLCLRCHAEPALMETAGHEGAEEKRCTACHDPHGGPDRFFLKAKTE